MAEADADLLARARDALDLRDARRVAKRKDGVFREEEFRAAHAALIDRIEVRTALRRSVSGA